MFRLVNAKPDNKTKHAVETGGAIYIIMALIIHRDFAGEHETDSRECWCGPSIVEDPDSDIELARNFEGLWTRITFIFVPSFSTFSTLSAPTSKKLCA